jgi:nicotinamide-nucleotide amidase
MAATTAELMRANLALAVTGVGGPDPQDGQPVGTTWFAVASEGQVTAECQQFEGDPVEIVQATVRHGLRLLTAAVRR